MKPVNANSHGRYAIRVTGPAGHSRYVTLGGLQTDDPEGAYAYRDAGTAHQAALSYGRNAGNAVCDVVNLDDPEDTCHE